MNGNKYTEGEDRLMAVVQFAFKTQQKYEPVRKFLYL